MERQDWMNRIVIDPAIHHGEPCIKNTRVPVSMIVGSIADGDTSEDILAAYPSLLPCQMDTFFHLGRN